MVRKSIQVSKKLHKFLEDNAVRKTDTYEEIIWRLLGLKTLTEKQKKEVEPSYVKHIDRS